MTRPTISQWPTRPAHEAVCFFWHEMALFVGPALVSAPHRHYGVELTLALDGELDVSLASGPRVERLGGALFGSNVTHHHRIRASTMAQLTVGPLTASGLALRASLGNRPVGLIQRSEVEPFVPELRQLVDRGDGDSAHAIARALVERFSTLGHVEPPDGGIVQAMNRLLGNFATSTPLQTYATEAGLSESRFCQVFRNNVGIPMRTYRRWLRLRAALVFGLSGWDLSDAAQEAGFADQADFTRASRQAFGVPPSSITRHPTSVFVEATPKDAALMLARAGR